MAPALISRVRSHFFNKCAFHLWASAMLDLEVQFTTRSISTSEHGVSVDSIDVYVVDSAKKVSDIPCFVSDEMRNQLQEHQVPKNSADVLRAWGCTPNQISHIFKRANQLRNANFASVQYKLDVLHELGFSPDDLVKIITCRPRFLNGRFDQCFDERMEYFIHLFGSKEMLQKAILRNPSLLTYDLETQIKPVVKVYDSIGLSRNDLSLMLISRPTLIPRTSLNQEKFEFINRTGVTKDSKMYKYVVTLFAVSRVKTIREKVANLEKFGLSEDEAFKLFGYSPLLLTLSVDKVQRNMTFIIATLKLPASVVRKYPFLLLANLERVLKPRMLLADKIHDMGLVPKINGRTILTALRMNEKLFVKTFIDCHPKDIAKELEEYYTSAKSAKRLAEDSKKNLILGFPF